MSTLHEIVIASRIEALNRCSLWLGNCDVPVNAAPLLWPECPETQISPIVRMKMDLSIRKSWAASTSAKYSNGVQQFHKFCDEQGVDTRFRLPSSEFLLCAFAASHLGTHAGSTARGHMSSVRA